MNVSLDQLFGVQAKVVRAHVCAGCASPVPNRKQGALLQQRRRRGHHRRSG